MCLYSDWWAGLRRVFKFIQQEPDIGKKKSKAEAETRNLTLSPRNV